jgi:hypothetical protein
MFGIKNVLRSFKKGMFRTKCEYALKCAAYRDNSYTCTKELDKCYCGIFRQFAQGIIKAYKNSE